MDNSQRKKQFLQLGLTIGYYRKLKGLTQGELARAVGVSRTHISNIEAPGMKLSVSLDKLFDIADVLNVPVAKLFEFREWVVKTIRKGSCKIYVVAANGLTKTVKVTVK